MSFSVPFYIPINQTTSDDMKRVFDTYKTMKVCEKNVRSEFICMAVFQYSVTDFADIA
jgi:hypothetical protein